MCPLAWVLGTKLKSPGRIVSALKHLAISPAPNIRRKRVVYLCAFEGEQERESRAIL